jgi:uncharacterized protein DUF1580
MTKSNQKKKRPKQPVKPAGTRQSLRKSIICIKTQAEAALSTLDSLSLPETTPRSARSTRSKNSANIGAFDIATEAPISFLEASELIPTHPSPSTISRWCDVGCRGVTLASTYYGGRRKTTPGAVERFLSECHEHNFAGMADVDSLEKAWAAKEQLAEERRDDGDADSLQGGNPSGRDAKRRKRRPQSPTQRLRDTSPARKSTTTKTFQAVDGHGRRKPARSLDKGDRAKNGRPKH